jgi:hypothetical protein
MFRPLLSSSSGKFHKTKLLKVMLRPTVSRTVFLGITHPSGAYDQIFITVRQLWVCWYGAPSLTRGRVCLLQCTIYNIFTFYMLLPECIYNIYKVFVSPGSVQTKLLEFSCPTMDPYCAIFCSCKSKRFHNTYSVSTLNICFLLLCWRSNPHDYWINNMMQSMELGGKFVI